MALLSFFRCNRNSLALKKNVIGSVLLKGVSMVVSFIVVPLAMDLVNPVQFGIWLTISSLMAWFYYFDFGLTLGFRNKFTEAKSLGHYDMARKYVSTTYATISAVVLVLLAVTLILNRFLDWSSLLNLDVSLNDTLHAVFSVMIVFFSLSLILQVTTTMLTADQRPAKASLISVLGQVLALSLLLLLKVTEAGANLLSLAVIFSGAPVLVTLVYTVVAFRGKYRQFTPRLKHIDFSIVKNIMMMGGKFFFITLSMLFIFQLMNVIISRELGVETVTEYNIAYKYFNIMYMLAVVFLNPFWSAFTEAYTKKNYAWMKGIISKLEKVWLISVALLAAMVLGAPYFYEFWIKDTVAVAPSTNIYVAVYMAILTLSNVYMFLINGIGHVQIQLVIYVMFALIAYPVMSWMCREWGIAGLLVIPSLVYLVQAVFMKIQLNKILTNTARGIWMK